MVSLNTQHGRAGGVCHHHYRILQWILHWRDDLHLSCFTLSGYVIQWSIGKWERWNHWREHSIDRHDGTTLSSYSNNGIYCPSHSFDGLIIVWIQGENIGSCLFRLPLKRPSFYCRISAMTETSNRSVVVIHPTVSVCTFMREHIQSVFSLIGTGLSSWDRRKELSVLLRIYYFYQDRSRRNGYLEFNRQTRNLRRTPLIVISGGTQRKLNISLSLSPLWFIEGNALLVALIKLMEDYLTSTSTFPQPWHCLALLTTVEVLIILSALIWYLGKFDAP